MATPANPAPAKQSAFEQAVALANAGRIRESVPLFARAVKAHPKDAVLRFNLANALRLSGSGKEAAQEYEACLRLNPGLMDARMNLTLLYNELGRPAKAVEQAKAILARHPLHAGAILALCVAAKQTQTVTDLLPYLDGIITPLLAAPLPPPGIERDRHHYAVGGVCELLERYDDAARHLLSARSMPMAFSMGLRLRSTLCDWTDYAPLRAALTAQAQKAPDQVGPLCFITLSDDPALQRRVAAGNATRLDRGSPLPQARPGGQRLRVGYLSADMRTHPVAFLVADTIARHDRDRFEIFLYSYGPDDGSAWRRKFQAMGRFADLRQMSDLEAAQMITRDKIDVLVDLTGHTGMMRLPILAYRPAKVAVSWLGYPGTLGWDAVDYIVADHMLIPPEAEQHYSEAVIRLPVTYQPSSLDRAPGPDDHAQRPAPGRVLSAFNQTFKITPEIFDIWCRLLGRYDDAVLWLFSSDKAAEDNLRREAQARGIGGDRLIFAQKAPLQQHLARYRHVDLQLDTFPYGGHTTTSDALMMACPVLALCGDSFPSRVAASLLNAVGLTDFISHSFQEYESKAMALLDNPEKLAEARNRIAARNAILFQPERFCRELEYAYTTILARKLAGERPSPLDVPLASAN